MTPAAAPSPRAPRPTEHNHLPTPDHIPPFLSARSAAGLDFSRFVKQRPAAGPKVRPPPVIVGVPPSTADGPGTGASSHQPPGLRGIRESFPRGFIGAGRNHLEPRPYAPGCHRPSSLAKMAADLSRRCRSVRPARPPGWPGAGRRAPDSQTRSMSTQPRGTPTVRIVHLLCRNCLGEAIRSARPPAPRSLLVHPRRISHALPSGHPTGAQSSPSRAIWPLPSPHLLQETGHRVAVAAAPTDHILPAFRPGRFRPIDPNLDPVCR